MNIPEFIRAIEAAVERHEEDVREARDELLNTIYQAKVQLTSDEDAKAVEAVRR